MTIRAKGVAIAVPPLFWPIDVELDMTYFFACITFAASPETIPLFFQADMRPAEQRGHIDSCQAYFAHVSEACPTFILESDA